MENHLQGVGVIEGPGATMAAPLRPDAAIPQIATRDIAAVAARRLLARDFNGRAVVELLGCARLHDERIHPHPRRGDRQSPTSKYVQFPSPLRARGDAQHGHLRQRGRRPPRDVRRASTRASPRRPRRGRRPPPPRPPSSISPARRSPPPSPAARARTAETGQPSPSHRLDPAHPSHRPAPRVREDGGQLPVAARYARLSRGSSRPGQERAPWPRSPTISSYLIRRLQDYGIRDVFGIPGDYVLGFYDQCRRTAC